MKITFGRTMAVLALVMIPVAGLTFGLTLRLAVKPFVETLADVPPELELEPLEWCYVGGAVYFGAFAALSSGCDCRVVTKLHPADRALLVAQPGAVHSNGRR